MVPQVVYALLAPILTVVIALVFPDERVKVIAPVIAVSIAPVIGFLQAMEKVFSHGTRAAMNESAVRDLTELLEDLVTLKSKLSFDVDDDDDDGQREGDTVKSINIKFTTCHIKCKSIVPDALSVAFKDLMNALSMKNELPVESIIYVDAFNRLSAKYRTIGLFHCVCPIPREW